MNKIIEKIVIKLQSNNEPTKVRRDQIVKALEEKAFDYIIHRNDFNVGNPPTRKLAEGETIRKAWLDNGSMWAELKGNQLVVIISFGSEYMELYANLVKESKPVKKNKIKASIKETVAILSDEELILKSNDWIESLKGTTSQLNKELSNVELIQLGTKLIAMGR